MRNRRYAQTHGHTHTHTGRELDSLSGSHRSPAGPSTGLLMGCGIDRPSVSVSRCITVNGRGTQKSRGEARGRGEEKEKGETEGSNSFLLLESLAVSFSQRHLLILEEKT